MLVILRIVEGDGLVQRPAHRLQDRAFDLVDQPVRIDHLTAVDRRHRAHQARRVRSRGSPRPRWRWRNRPPDSCSAQRQSRSRDSAAAFCPFCQPKPWAAFSMTSRPRAIVEMLQAELDRIGAGDAREFVHETLDREHVVIGAERPHRRNPHRHRRDEVMHHLRVGKFVDRDRVAIAAAFRQRNRLRRRHGETAAPCAGPPASIRRRPAASNGCCSRLRNSSRRSRRCRRATPSASSPSPGRTAPRRAPARASIARARARRAARARSTRRRPRHRRRRYGRNSRSLRHGCSANARRRHAQHFGDALAVGIDTLGVGPDRHRAVD